MKKGSLLRIGFITAILTLTAGLAPANSINKEILKKPRPTIEGTTEQLPPELAVPLAELNRAKREGDASAVAHLHEQLGWTGMPTSSGGAEIVFRMDRSHNQLKWGGDVLVNNPDWSSGFQAMTCRSDGTFYVVTVDMSNDGYLDLYSSTDGGATWFYEYSIHEPMAPVFFPSIAIGEGTYDRLLIAYEVGRNTAAAKVVVYWRDFDTEDYDLVTVDSYPNNIAGRPKICVDSPEYSVWYAYLTFVRGSPGALDYELMFSRTLDYGNSWVTPVSLATSLNYDDDHDLDFGAAGLFCAWSKKTTTNDLIASWSIDFGATFTGAIVLTASSRDEFEPSVAVSNTGETVVVGYTVDYGVPDYDIEAWVTTDGADHWDWAALPYNYDYESFCNMTYDPVTSSIHAAFCRNSGTVTTHAEQMTPLNWSPLLRVNQQQSATYFPRRSIAADPTGTHGVGIAWMDDRDPDKYGVYFDASQVIHPRAVDYLMICPDVLIDQAAALAQYRELRGYGVHLVTMSQIGPAPLSAEDIDLFVEDYAFASPQLRFLALIGDVDLLPGFLVTDGSEQWYSDLRYADTDGNFTSDYRPDIAVGRIPVSQAGELADYVAKVKVFEQTFRHRNKVLFFGDQAEMSYVTNRDSLTISDNGYVVTTLYEPSEAQLLTELNDPALAMVLYYGHGSFANNWPLHLGNLDSWTNFDGPVLYFSGGCNFNDNMIPSQPLGHELLFTPGCAAAATGATVNGGYGYNYEYIHVLLHDSWLYTTMGELHQYALREHYNVAAAQGQDVSLGSWVQLFTGRMMCHGDPALRIDGDVTAVPESLPGVLYLSQNYPNPFNPRTTIAFDLPEQTVVDLRVYDVSGKLADVLLVNEIRGAGRNEVVWEGRDQTGLPLPAGVYFYRLETGGFSETKRMTLVK